MVVKKTLSWLKKSRKKPGPEPVEQPVFYCSLCDRVIDEQEMAFDAETGRLYHTGRCALDMNGRINEVNDTRNVLNVDYIDRPVAVRLYLEGRLMEKPGEREKIDLEEKMGR
jgi:hypothetical protein